MSRIGIDDQGRVPRADAGDAAAGEVRLLPRHAAPHIDAAIGERAFVRIELRPHRRMDAVAGHQHVALLRLQRGAVRGDEARGDARIALLDADAAMAGDEVLRPEPLRARHRAAPDAGRRDGWKNAATDARPRAPTARDRRAGRGG